MRMIFNFYASRLSKKDLSTNSEKIEFASNSRRYFFFLNRLSAIKSARYHCEALIFQFPNKLWGVHCMVYFYLMFPFKVRRVLKDH
jgi:hypothetical protein